MKARAAGLVAFTLVAAVGLTACGGSHAIKPLSLKNAPPLLRDLNHPHRFTPAQIKAAFASQGITLRVMRTPVGAHAVVLFDSRWPAPTKSQLGNAPRGPYTWVFLHSTDNDSVSVGNVYVSDGPRERNQSVNAALDTLYRSYYH